MDACTVIVKEGWGLLGYLLLLSRATLTQAS